MVRITPADRAIGIILPSSNRVVERATAAVLLDYPDVDACFARVSYHGHGNGQPADGYDIPAFAAAADLLTHAGVGVICWNGTRGAAMGFEPDRRLCDELSRRTGVPAVTTALATLDLLKQAGIGRVSIVTQGLASEGEMIVTQFRRQGIAIAGEHHLGITDNFAAANTPLRTLERHVEAFARMRNSDAVLIWSTNLPGHDLVRTSVARFGLPVLDSATVGVLSALKEGFGLGSMLAPDRIGRASAEIGT
jgi:maleate isomerase